MLIWAFKLTSDYICFQAFATRFVDGNCLDNFVVEFIEHIWTMYVLRIAGILFNTGVSNETKLFNEI